MEYSGEDRRKPKRSYIEPYDTGSFLEFSLDGEEYRFNLLDTSPRGMGMLVTKTGTDVLEKISIHDRIEMKYRSLEASVFMSFEVKHITPIERGPLRGHYQVGLSLLSDR